MNLKEKRSKIARDCGRHAIALHSQSDTKHITGFLRLRCNSWLCPYCRKKKAHKFSKATDAYFQDAPLVLLTITMDRTLDLWHSWAKISGNWNRFRTALARRIGRFRFIRVLEPQSKSQYPHYHILLDRTIQRRTIAPLLARAGFGKIFDIRKITDGGGKFYVKKYLKKAWGDGQGLEAAVGLGARRVSGGLGFKISGRRTVSWASVKNLRGPRQMALFSALVGTNFQNQLWHLVGTQVADDWIRLDWELSDWLGVVSGGRGWLTPALDGFTGLDWTSLDPRPGLSVETDTPPPPAPRPTASIHPF